jgi:hypothetical protein
MEFKREFKELGKSGEIIYRETCGKPKKESESLKLFDDCSNALTSWTIVAAANSLSKAVVT